MPGLAGSAIEARLDSGAAISWRCHQIREWHIAFLSVVEALQPLCLCDELALFYDEPTNTYANQEGVHLRPHDFGGVEGIEALDPFEPSYTATMLPLTMALKAIGYEPRRDLFGAPYDWRLAADGLVDNGFFHNLTALIERAWSTNGNAPVVIVAHSMGNIVLAFFFTLWGREWTSARIAKVVAVSGPWAGAVTALKGPISGSNFNLYFPHNLLHSLQGSVASGPWLFPQPHLWRESEVLIETLDETYTSHNISKLLESAGLRQLAEIYPHVKHLNQPLVEGTFNVPLLCVHGVGVPTASRYKYRVKELVASSSPEPETISDDDGDGTVNIRSLRACAASGTRGMTNVIEIDGASHLGIISSGQLVHAIISSVSKPSHEGMRIALRAAEEGRPLMCRRGWRKWVRLVGSPRLWIAFWLGSFRGPHDMCANGAPV